MIPMCPVHFVCPVSLVSLVSPLSVRSPGTVSHVSLLSSIFLLGIRSVDFRTLLTLCAHEFSDCTHLLLTLDEYFMSAT